MNLRETIRKVIKEQQDIKDVEFLYKIIKRIIPDNSVFTSRYDMPYADTGEVEVYIEYSVTPKTEINKSSEGYYTINLHLDIEKLMWKGPYDDDFENVPGLYDIPEYIFSELGYEHRKRLEKLVGELYFDQDYDYKQRRD